jgi:AcrR family transcriptional regulator
VGDNGRPLRADARNNRNRILAAARDVFVEQGPGAPLDEIARRAGCGIATLYRRFPDRQALMAAVVVDALERTIDEARTAIEEESEPFAALTRYMHRALDVRTGAVIPALLEEVSLDDPRTRRAREEGSRILEALVAAAHGAGTLRPEITAADIGLLVVRLSRPLPGAFSDEVNREIGHRHLDLLIGGIRAAAPSSPVEGPVMTMDDLHAMVEEGSSRA